MVVPGPRARHGSHQPWRPARGATPGTSGLLSGYGARLPCTLALPSPADEAGPAKIRWPGLSAKIAWRKLAGRNSLAKIRWQRWPARRPVCPASSHSKSGQRRHSGQSGHTGTAHCGMAGRPMSIDEWPCPECRVNPSPGAEAPVSAPGLIFPSSLRSRYGVRQDGLTLPGSAV